ncbi:lipase 1-like [Cylas formicarius]|uniref:lipase 1-like n=1 Tax=Cylas formicarius TaxID=197179 RepID=UPI002958B172|nr:lipase 1-like [Cylas formicarius]
MVSIQQVILMVLNYIVNQPYRFVSHPDSGLSLERLLEKYGYPLETHEITTEDGYVLTAHRIPRGQGSNHTNQYPIIITAGPCTVGEFLLLPGHPEGIAWYLTDRGFDVWLVNNRGTAHSRKHKTLDPDSDAEYWNFSWHEMGVYDLPAVVDYILNVTTKNKLFYLGYAQGATIYFVLNSERPEYNEKIAMGVVVATPAMLGRNRLLIFRVLSKHRTLIKNIAKALGVYEFLPDNLNAALRRTMSMLCSEMTVFAEICSALLHFPEESFRVDPMVLQLIFEYVPARCSMKQFYHYQQLIDSDVFGPYDYGAKQNLRLYKRRNAPEYNIGNVTAPTAFVYSTSDLITHPEGIERLVARTKNKEVHRITDEFSHVDFVAAKEVRRYVNEPVYRMFEKHMPATS